MMRALALLVILLSACSDSSNSVTAAAATKAMAAKSTTSKPVDAHVAQWDATKCGDDEYQNARMERHPALMGLPLQALVKAYGAPSERENFKVGEPVGVFYGPLGKMPVGRAHKNIGAPATVLTWTRNGCNFSVFFIEKAGTTSAVHAFEWAVGSDF